MIKAALQRLAIELRDEIGLSAREPFDPYLLADCYGISVLKLSELDCSPAALAHFQQHQVSVLSGALVPIAGGGAVIIDNDAHSLERRRATVSHEMAHVTLEHQFSTSLTDGRGRCRLVDKAQEDEAAELAGEMLLPISSAKRLAWDGASDQEAAQQFCVSVELARWRLNSTGARRIARRAGRRAPAC